MAEHGSDAGPELLAETAPGSRGRKKGNGGKPPKKGAGLATPRVTKAELHERISLVLSLIVDGICRERSLMRTLATAYREGKITWTVRPDGTPASDNPAAVSRRTLQLYMARALAELQTIADEQRPVAKSKARARYERALSGAIAAKQWDVARRVTRDMARLDGLEPGLRVTHDGTITNDHTGSTEVVHRSGGTIEERAAAVTDLFNRAAARRDMVSRQGQASAASN